MVLRTIGRIIWVPISFLIAAALAMLVLVTLGLETITHAVHNLDEADTISAAYDVIWQGTIIASGATILPALLVVIAGEVARIRSWLYYMIGGGVALAIIPLLAKIDPGTMTYALPALWHVFATAGFAGGLAYWLLAGRNA
ncbi:MAG: hypothetical protein K2Y42_12485 [Hyphomicrobium sp.]|jgi:hypothetical protein|uniref:hypothetical protein n=1 Tax=Hyphomicrobium sp. TaxID=82 RepID=UPI0025C4BDCB|nr:hypothetical protein [Hyphomicrobium sp.]MBX9863557.1 hypothetical protein [Hyphomicrobium sp.]